VHLDDYLKRNLHSSLDPLPVYLPKKQRCFMLPTACASPSPTIYFTPFLRKSRNLNFRTTVLKHNRTKTIVFINHETSNSHRRDHTFHSIPLQIRSAEFSPLIDMIYLIEIWLTPGGSSTVHIYTQTIHRTTQATQTIHRTT
jgi:hypothetical protein